MNIARFARPVFALPIAACAMGGAPGSPTAETSSASTSTPNCYSDTSIESVVPAAPPFRVFRVPSDPPLTDVDPDYTDYPVTDCVGRPWGNATRSTQTLDGVWEFVWGDRAFLGKFKKPNDANGVIVNSAGVECRPEFTTYLKAIGSTAIKMMWSDGYEPRADPLGAAAGAVLVKMGLLASAPASLGWLDLADAFGYDTSFWDKHLTNTKVLNTDDDLDTGPISHHAFYAARADTLFVYDGASGDYKTTRDRVILGQGRLADMPVASVLRGSFMDFEMDDGRGETLLTETVELLHAIAFAKRYKLILDTDPLLGAGSELGITINNGHQILDMVDGIDIVIDSDPPAGGEAADLASQMLFFAGPKGDLAVDTSKLLLQMSVGAAGKEIGEAVVDLGRTFALANDFGGVIIAPDYATFGAACSSVPNQRIATLLGISL